MADSNLGGGNPDAATAAAGAGGNNTNPDPNSGTPADKGVGGTGGGGESNKEKVYTFKEDRTDWTPRFRLNEVSGKLTKAEERLKELETELGKRDQKLRIALGVEHPDPKAQEAEEIRNAIYDLVPEIGALKGLTKDQLQDVLDAAHSARATSQTTWERHALSMLGDVEEATAESLGVEKLTPTQQTRLRRAYHDEAALAMQQRHAAFQREERETLESLPSDNDFVARHERGDKALVKEFVKAFLDDWFEPARRSVTAAQARRNLRPVPRGERTRVFPAQGAQKVDLTDNAEFKKALLAARGGERE